MKKTFVFLLTLILIGNLKAQNNERIINDILFDLFHSRNDTLLIEQEISKPVFDYDSLSIKEKTGLKLPGNIINEWKYNIKHKNTGSLWNENKLNNSTFKNYALYRKKPVFKCIPKSEFENNNNQNVIFSISEIVLDDKKETGIFSFCVNGKGIFTSETILIKKIYEKWIIIEKFDFTIR